MRGVFILFINMFLILIDSDELRNYILAAFTEKK